MSNAITKTSATLQVRKWVLEGGTLADIEEAIAATFPDAKPRALIIQALKGIAKDGTPDADLLRGFCLEATRDIYRKALEVADHQTALRALKQLMEIGSK